MHDEILKKLKKGKYSTICDLSNQLNFGIAEIYTGLDILISKDLIIKEKSELGAKYKKK